MSKLRLATEEDIDWFPTVIGNSQKERYWKIANTARLALRLLPLVRDLCAAHLVESRSWRSEAVEKLAVLLAEVEE